ncbi:MAG: creatininase family protein [Thermaerobacterales bacterium]
MANTTVKLQELSWTGLRSLTEKTDLVLVPTGSIEAKGPHQPLGTDTVMAERMALEIARHVTAGVGPTIPVGTSASGAGQMPGAINAEMSSLENYLYDVCVGIHQAGFKKFVFVDGHSGNGPVIKSVAGKLVDKYGIEPYYILVHQAYKGPIVKEVTDSADPFGHGGEIETSILLHWFPELIDMDQAKPGPPSNVAGSGSPVVSGLKDQLVKFSPEGYTGDPSKATVEKGKFVADWLVEQAVTFIREKVI